MELFFLLFFGIVVAIVLFANARQADARRFAWQTAAHELGLEWRREKGDQLSMVGVVEGSHVQVRTFTTRNGNNKNRWTEYSAAYAAHGPSNLEMRRQGAMTTVKRWFGNKDVEIGDVVFDQRIELHGDETALRNYLTPARRVASLSLFDHFDDATITNSMIRVRVRRYESSHLALIGTLRRLSATAAVLGNPGPIDAAVELEEVGDLGAGIDAMAASRTESPNDLTVLLEAEARVVSGDREGGAALLDELADRWPADSEVAGWREVAHTPAPPLPTDPAPTTAPPTAEAPPATPASTTAALSRAAPDVIHDLFGSPRPGYEVEAHFADAYRGAAVRWRGVVERVTAYHSDRDFDAEGVKAVITVGHLGEGRLVSDRVDAVVQLPVGATLEREQSVEFTGTLLRVDRFMKNVYVADAVII